MELGYVGCPIWVESKLYGNQLRPYYDGIVLYLFFISKTCSMVNIDSDLYFVYIMSLTFEKKYYKKVSSLDLIYAFFSLEHSNRQDTCSLNLRGVLEGHMNCYRLTN